jgi:hypothetical protein
MLRSRASNAAKTGRPFEEAEKKVAVDADADLGGDEDIDDLEDIEDIDEDGDSPDNDVDLGGDDDLGVATTGDDEDHEN